MPLGIEPAVIVEKDQRLDMHHALITSGRRRPAEVAHSPSVSQSRIGCVGLSLTEAA
jgi:hypothetical protein